MPVCAPPTIQIVFKKKKILKGYVMNFYIIANYKEKEWKQVSTKNFF